MRASELAPTYGLERAALGAVGVGDGVGDALGQLGGEPVARQVDQHGDPRTQRLGHLEHPHQLALLQPDDGRDELGERCRLQLEHELARQVLEHRCASPVPVWACIRASLRSRASATAAPTPGMASTLTR